MVLMVGETRAQTQEEHTTSTQKGPSPDGSQTQDLLAVRRQSFKDISGSTHQLQDLFNEMSISSPSVGKLWLL